MKKPYAPPFTISPRILELVEHIGEILGRLSLTMDSPGSPVLRKENKIRTIHGSLAIEGNSLNLEQVTAIIEGKRVLGSFRDIQEVHNAVRAYESIDLWDPYSMQDLLAAHTTLMHGLMEKPGVFRNGTVIIKRGMTMVHMPPPAHLVPDHIERFFRWLASTKVHPLVSSSIFHYELEFIHPFFDGNGRLGRLWQTVILGHWKPILALLPLESLVHDRQKQYYEALGQSDQSGESTPFVEFILSALKDTCSEIQETDHVTDHVASLLSIMSASPRSVRELMKCLNLNHRPSFRQNYLTPALEAHLVEMTDPDSPKSPKQKYRLTGKGRRYKFANQHSD